MTISSRHALVLITSGFVFLFFVFQVAGFGKGMFIDTDPLWHVAAGDLIRKAGAIPLSDPWSFTATGYRWLNISWAWDSLFSLIHERLGWHGAAAINAITISLTLTLIYVTCLLRCGGIAASLLTTLLIVTTCSLDLRPLQITNLMVAGWMLLLGSVMRNQLRPIWLAVLPLTMVIWVNCHGGFLAGLSILGFFLLQTLREKRKMMALCLFAALLVTLVATCLNPYGITIYQAAWRPLMTVANHFILEWQAFTTTPTALARNIVLILILCLVPGRILPIHAAERWLTYFWLLMYLMSVRHISIFGAIAAPVLACALKPQLDKWLMPFKVPQGARAHMSVPVLIWLFCALTTLWVPTAGASRFYRQETIELPTLKAETEYLASHFPKARLLNHFNLGGILLYETRGKVPVFVDPRTETAFPAQVLKDYSNFIEAKPGWEEMLTRYKIDGIILPNESDDTLLDRFQKREGWSTAFKGPKATIFLRDRK